MSLKAYSGLIWASYGSILATYWLNLLHLVGRYGSWVSVCVYVMSQYESLTVNRCENMAIYTFVLRFCPDLRVHVWSPRGHVITVSA